MKSWLIGLATTLLASACAAAQAADAVPGTLLVGNKGEDTLSFVALADGRELGRTATGKMPHEIAVSPNGRQAAVVAYGGATIDLFDVATRAKLRTIDLVPNDGPHGLLWLDDGRLVATAERSRTLVVIDPQAGDALTAIPTDQEGTHMVTASRDARRAYTANMQSGSVTVIDLADGAKLTDFQVGGTPEGIALTPDGRTLWIADSSGARVQAFEAAVLERPARLRAPVVDISFAVNDGVPEELRATVVAPLERALRRLPGVASVESQSGAGTGGTSARFAAGADAEAAKAAVMRAVRTAGASFPQGRTAISVRVAAGAPLATVATGDTPIRVAVSPDGRWIVTSNNGDGTLTVIDAATRKVARTIAVSGSRDAGQVTILFSPDGRRLYVAETGRDQVAEVDFGSGKVLRRLPAGKNGDGLGLAP